MSVVPFKSEYDRRFQEQFERNVADDRRDGRLPSAAIAAIGKELAKDFPAVSDSSVQIGTK